MLTSSEPRKIFQGVATRSQMFSLFDRHRQMSSRFDGDVSALYAGEWFAIGEAEHDYMFDILPPLWIRGDTFAMREFMTGSVTSVFFTLQIDGAIRHFHSYCDLADTQSVGRMRQAINQCETRPLQTMTRDEQLEHIWSMTSDAYRGYSNDDHPQHLPGRRMIIVFSDGGTGRQKLLADLTDTEIAAKLPVHLRYLPDAIAA
ncbi:DUF1419 domain-containing protein [Allorhizobium ampelinum]|nr:DUF1419 domain-containing protein [Allorhizobium ampelinum]